MHREKPSSSDDMLTELWYAVIGTNGEGMMTRQKELEDKFDEYIASERERTCFYLKDKEDGGKRNAKILSIIKYAVSEGIKLGTAIGAFSWIKSQL